MMTHIRLRRPLWIAFIALLVMTAGMAPDGRAQRSSTLHVNAGEDQSVDAGVLVILSGTVWDEDPDGSIASYTWEQEDGTEVSLSADGTIAMFTAPGVLADEELTFLFTVTDDVGAVAEDVVRVVVRADDGDSVNRFILVSAGGDHTCGLLETGAVQCWGDNDNDQSTPPTGVFTEVSAGRYHTCGLLETGAVQCWGWDRHGQSTPPTGTFTAVSAGGYHACGLLETGAVQCWGDDLDGQSTPPTGTFTAVSAGHSHTCGLLETGAVQCWGYRGFGLTTPPTGAFTAVSAGSSHICGLLETGAVQCWGSDDRYGESTPPTGTFTAVSAGYEHICGLLETGAVQCWGDNLYGQSTPPVGTFVAVSAGDEHTCGLLETGAVQCWGDNRHGQSTPPTGTFTAVDAGGVHTCGLLETGAVQCWGDNGNGQSTPPTGTFVAVSAGYRHTCGLLETGAVQCWGFNRNGQSTPPVGTFTAVSAGALHTCGLLETGAVQCWGDNGNGWSTPPTGTFVAVSAGVLHTCGLLETGAVQCWGFNRYGESTPPVGTFVAVSAGDEHTCGLLETDAVACWGLRVRGVEEDADGRLRVSSTSPLAEEVETGQEWERLGLVMTRVAGGSFIMGCQSDRDGVYGDCFNREKPAHRVEVGSFEIGKYEVTQALWQAVMGGNPSHFKGCSECPVEKVSWDDVQAFLQRLNALTGNRYRLPTESEWEYAARGGRQSGGYKYAGGNDVGSVGWYSDNSGGRTHPVGRKDANELGLHDMSGSVWEWVQDCLNGSHEGAPGDGRARERGDCSQRVARGGSWISGPRYLRAAYRIWGTSGLRSGDLGFRIARTLTP